MVMGELVAAVVSCTDAEDDAGAGLSLPIGVHGTDGAVGDVVLVGVVVAVVVVVVVVVDAIGSHESACDGELAPGESVGCAMLTATGVVTRSRVVAETARVRVSVCLRRVKCGADFKAIRYPSSSTCQSGAAPIAPLWTCWIESPPGAKDLGAIPRSHCGWRSMLTVKSYSCVTREMFISVS